MELTISYLLKTAIVLLVLYLFYYGLLRNQTNFSFNRLYLLVAPLVAMIIPLVEWPVALAPEHAVSEVLQSIQLTEITVTAYRPEAVPATKPYFSTATLALGIYAIGAFWVLLKLVKQLWQVKQVKGKATVHQTANGDVQVYQLPDHYATFAFGSAIFLSNQEHLSKADQEKILTHELAHVQLHHTWDVLYYELLTAILWLNPVVWLLKQELRDIHEYQADAKVLRTYPAQEYSALLSREVLQQMGLPIGSYFQKPQVLKRLRMLQQNGQQAGWLRPLLVMPLLGGLLFVFSLQLAGAQDVLPDAMVQASSKEPNHAEMPDQVSSTAVPESTVEDVAAQSVQAGSLPEETALKEKAATVQVPTNKDVKRDHIAESSAVEKPFSYVEQMPYFEGGESEMLKYLAMNIRYPKEAQLEKVEGLVVVAFNVEKDGSLNDVVVLKSVEESIDAEAVRVVKQMNGRWQPGRQNGEPVQVKYTLPVRFTIK